jgi:hypothetical protein
MSAPFSRILTLGLAVLLVGTAATASARPKKHRAPQHSPARTSTGIVNCDGTPIIMVGIECKKRPVAREEQPAKPTEEQLTKPGGEEQATKPVVRPRITSRGSGGIYAPARLTPPSVPLAQPSTGVYIPPPVSNPSAQIHDLNQGFQFNRGLGNNPTDRDSFIRYNLTR